MKKNVLIVGAGAVGAVAAHKCAQHSDVFSSVCIASRTTTKCHDIIQEIHKKGHHPAEGFALLARSVDAYDTDALITLIRELNTDIVINVCTAFVNRFILDACMETGAAYIDTAVHEDYDVMNASYPWYANFEWKKRDACKDKGITAILGAGFDPGVVNAYCAYAQRNEFDHIHSIDILDVNDGHHGRFFSTNFDPEINLREIIEDAGCLEDGKWRTYPHHSRSMEYDFPEVGSKKVYLMGHDEVHSLSVNIEGLQTVRFWMGFDDHYLNCVNVFKNVGLLNHQPVKVGDGQDVVPLHLLKACLPDPASLASNYTGKTCIGTLIKGTYRDQSKEVFIYNICDHEAAFADANSQAIAFTAGVPPVAAAILVANGSWDVKTMVNVEELDPAPFLTMLTQMGLSTQIRVMPVSGQVEREEQLCVCVPDLKAM
ncbi:MAG: saccharopine dehydrogenase family protein [Pseudomonadales bacterium]|nr:saccharopine dehydrogenase family protein [Pseudomonadales bacterium]